MKIDIYQIDVFANELFDGWAITFITVQIEI